MPSLRTFLDRARAEAWAVPHFNISDEAMLKGVCEAAQALRAPLLVGTSEGEDAFIGHRAAVALVRVFRDECGLAVFLNADHHRSVESATAAVDAGYDSVHIDLSKLPLEENIAGTREVVDYARARRPDISVEGEVGYLVTENSKVYSGDIEVPRGSLARVADAIRFVRETGVDRLAPAVGTIHGIAANRPVVDVERIREIHAAVGSVALVLHGGSGCSDEDVRRAVSAGIANVHFSTELRVAYTRALRQALAAHPDETTPYKFLTAAAAAVRDVAAGKITLFGAAGRA